MNPVTQARKDIKYLASLVRGLVALDEKLEEVGSVEKLVASLAAEVDAARHELLEVQKQVTFEQRNVESAKKQAAGIIAVAKDDAAGALEAADKEAEGIRAQAIAARKEAADTLAAAQKEAVQIKADALSATTAHNKAAQEAKVTRDMLAYQIAESQKKLEQLTAAIAALKSKF